jgi:hypothetical protein
MADPIYSAATTAELLQYGAPSISTPGSSPTISNVTPTPNTTISRTQTVGCDVTDADGASDFRRVILAVELPNGAKEIVHDGSAFCTPYATSSARSSITNGYHYDIVRDGGWPSRFSLTVYAIDTTGNEAA